MPECSTQVVPIGRGLGEPPIHWEWIVCYRNGRKWMKNGRFDDILIKRPTPRTLHCPKKRVAAIGS